MDKSQLIEKLSSDFGFKTEEASLLLNEFVGAVRDYCKNLDAVAIPGFGTFQPVKTDEYVSTDTETGKRYLMPPTVEVKLKSSVVLRKKLIG